MTVVALRSSIASPQGSDKTAFRIIPAGTFVAVDGRPGGRWNLTPESASRIVAEAAARSSDYVIDYEHQTQNSERNGLPAPAAGWFRRVEFRADGIYAIDTRWTESARKMLDAGEYRYLSPVFEFNKMTGEVVRLISVGLTNDPALHGLTDLAALRARYVEIGAAAAAIRASMTSSQLELMTRMNGPNFIEDGLRAAAEEEARMDAPVLIPQTNGARFPVQY